MSATASAPVPRRGVGSQAVLLALATGGAQIITALLYILAARGTDPGNFGRVAAAIAVGTAAVGFLDFGTNSLWVREIARGKLEPAELGRRLAIKLAIAAILAVAFVVTSLTVWPTSTYWMAAPIGLALMVNQSSQVPLRGMARAELVSFSILADRVIAAGVLLVAMAFGALPHEVLWLSLSLGSITAATMGWLMTPRERIPILRFTRCTNPWQGAGFFGLNSVAVSAQSLDLPLLVSVGGATAAGLYGAVSRWTQPMGLLVGAFSSASAPFVARSESWEAAWAHVRKGIWLLGLAALGCLGVAAFTPIIVDLLIGAAYAGSADVLRILALAVLPAIANQPLSVFLQSMGYDKPVAFITIGSVVAQLIGVATLGTLMGALGAALSLGLVQILILAFLSVLAVTAFRGRSVADGKN